MEVVDRDVTGGHSDACRRAEGLVDSLGAHAVVPIDCAELALVRLLVLQSMRADCSERTGEVAVAEARSLGSTVHLESF